MADMDAPNGISSMFQVNPDGAGNLGNVSLTGYVSGYGSTVVTQTAAAVKYSFSSGAAVVAFPSPSNATLIAGQKYLYFSPDGNFVFGGSPTSWDFLVGVRTASGTPGFGGLYYQAGIDLSSVFDSYYGSLNANAGVAVGHQRVDDVLDGYLYGYTYSEAVLRGPGWNLQRTPASCAMWWAPMGCGSGPGSVPTWASTWRSRRPASAARACSSTRRGS